MIIRIYVNDKDLEVKNELDNIFKKNFPLKKDYNYKIDEEKITLLKTKKSFTEIYNDEVFKNINFPTYKWGVKKSYIQMIDLEFKDTEHFLEYKDKFEKIKIPFSGNKKTYLCYYPSLEIQNIDEVVSFDAKQKYPIFIVSKGRWDNCITAKKLAAMNVKFRIVVEEQEYDKYLQNFKPEELIILDNKYKEKYDKLDEYGLDKSTGPGPARNFAWETSIKEGYEFHWVLDDNIRNFHFYNDNKGFLVDESIFALPEMFIENYENIAISGLNYETFVMFKNKNKPYVKNTRIYSMLLIRNNIPFRWRGRYNEDTILSLDVLSNGYSTIQWNMFIGDKMTTQVLSGGNSDEFYFQEGTLPKSYMLWKTYPEYTKLKYKFNRWHHDVDYRPFKNNSFGKCNCNKIDYNYKILGKISSRKNYTTDLAEILGGRIIDSKSKIKKVEKLNKKNNYVWFNIREFKKGLVVVGSASKNFLEIELNKLKDSYDTIINFTENEIDVNAAIYALENKMNCYDLVPSLMTKQEINEVLRDNDILVFETIPDKYKIYDFKNYKIISNSLF